MAIRVTIKNEAPRPEAIVAVHTTDNVSWASAAAARKPVEIPAGESKEFWLHGSQNLKVWEVQG
jgi:hypothetical protein